MLRVFGSFITVVFVAGACASQSDSNGKSEPSSCCLDPMPVPCNDATVGVHAKDYDQHCATDADCAAVGEGDGCYPCEFVCPNAAVNRSAEASFHAAVAATPAGAQISLVKCGCPASFGPCCVQGTCHADLACTNQ